MELWRSIPGYEGIYEASNYGNIRTCEGKTTSNARFTRRVWKQRILKPKYGYRKGNVEHKDARVSLWKDSKERTWLVSRLVAITWCPGYFDGATVNHIDGNPLNNNAQNLEWVFLVDNIRHAFANGLIHTQKRCRLIDESGSVFDFQSMGEASRYIGRCTGYISNRIKKGILSMYSSDHTKYTLL